MNSSKLGQSQQREAYGLGTSSKNLDILMPEEVRPDSRQSKFKKPSTNKSMSAAHNPTATRTLQKKKRSTVYASNEAGDGGAGGSRKKTGLSKNPRQVESSGSRAALHSGAGSRKSKNLVNGSQRESVSRFQATMGVLDAQRELL